MDFQHKTEQLAQKLSAMSARGLVVSPEIVEDLEVLDRAIDQLLGMLDSALEPAVQEKSKPTPIPEFDTFDDLLEEANTSSLGASGGISVLLVEDNMVNRKLAVLILERIGCQVDIAVNGSEGVEKFRSGTYQAIFMDCQMPVMDGYAATRAIRQLEAGASHVPIIAVTANAMKGDKEKCLECGMDDYISKPIRPTDLQGAVSRWCNVHA